MKDIPEEHIRQWAKGLIQSDRKAFDALFRALYPRLVKYAFKMVKDWDSATDIVQDTFVILWQKRRDMDPDRSVRAYLYRAVRNRALNFLRDRREVMEPIDDLLTEDSSAADDETEKEYEEAFKQKVYQWIFELPDRQREAFELSRFDGLHHKEIANVMDVSQKTVNNHLTAALKQLRKWYDADQKETRASRS